MGGKRKPTPPHWCSVCGLKMSRRVWPGRKRVDGTGLEPVSVFLKRKTCSPECASEWRKRNNPLADWWDKKNGERPISDNRKECVICGEMFSRHPKVGFSQFRRRQTCSRKCRRLLTSGITRDQWANGEGPALPHIKQKLEHPNAN